MKTWGIEKVSQDNGKKELGGGGLGGGAGLVMELKGSEEFQKTLKKPIIKLLTQSGK